MDKAAFDSEAFAEVMASGEAAFSGGDYELALEYFRKAITINPDDVHALSRAGAVATALNRPAEALEIFQKAYDISECGDNAFNLGNAYFFSGDFNRASSYYAKAELLGCSKKTRAQLYYQLSVMCVLRGDVANALTNFGKFEDFDETRIAASAPKMILEKLKLYLMAKDLDRAREYAVRLIGAEPQSPRGYMIYFNLLMTLEEYNEAERVLNEAFQYAVMDENQRLAADLERVTLLLRRASAEPEKAKESLSAAETLTRDRLAEADEGSRSDKQLRLTLAEVLVKEAQYEEAAAILAGLLEDQKVNLPEVKVQTDPQVPEIQLSDEELETALQADMEQMGQRIASGEIPDDIVNSAEVVYGPDGQEERQFPAGAFGTYEIPPLAENTGKQNPEQSALMREDFYERARYLYVSSLLSIDRYEPALAHTAMLAASKTVMYQFFGHYAEAYVRRQLGQDADGRLYADALAFFRKQMLARNNAAYAALFRSRLYAESGKYATAEEMVKLLPADQQKSADAYIASCRSKAAVS